MIDYRSLLEGSYETQSTTETKALTAKLKGINGYLQSLLQKRIRLDLEIKRTKRQISKLKKKSSLIVKTSIQLETASGPLTISQMRQICNRPSETSLQEFESALLETEKLLQEVATIPLIED